MKAYVFIFLFACAALPSLSISAKAGAYEDRLAAHDSRLRAQIRERLREQKADGVQQITQNIARAIGLPAVYEGGNDWRSSDGSIVCRAEQVGMSGYWVRCIDAAGDQVARLDFGGRDPYAEARVKARRRGK